MKTKSLMIAISLMAIVMGMTASAFAAAITVNPVASIDAKGAVNVSSIAPGGVFYIVVQASDVTGISAAALSLQYDKTKFDVVKARAYSFAPITSEVDAANLESDMFGAFTPKDTAQASQFIRLANADATNGLVKFSGAFIDSTTGNSKLTGKGNLFAIRFKANSSATSGTYTFKLVKTVLSNLSAGYDPAKPEADRTVPPLMKAAAYSTDTTAPFYNLTATTGGAFTAFVETTEYTLGETTVTIEAGANDVSSQVSIQLTLKAGWNMVALPVVPDDAKLTSVFPDATIAYSWQSNYVKATVLEAGLGYWVKVPTNRTYSITGTPLKKYQYKFSSPGWYMMAGPNGTATPVTDPANSIAIMYQYTPGTGYVKVTQLSAGNAYWVKIKNACTFTVTAP